MKHLLYTNKSAVKTIQAAAAAAAAAAALCPGLPWSASTRKVKPIWIY